MVMKTGYMLLIFKNMEDFYRKNEKKIGITLNQKNDLNVKYV